jgi:predicted transcriptional regulator
MNIGSRSKKVSRQTIWGVALNDTLVLMGLIDRHEEAERKGMNYYSYCQRLHRKKLLLRSVLRELGYSVKRYWIMVV